MDKDLKNLYSIAMSGLLMQTVNKRFFTQNEYESFKGKIDIIQSSTNNLNKKL